MSAAKQTNCASSVGSDPVEIDWIKCPECGGRLTVQWDGDDISVDCENDPDMDDAEAVENDIHRYWQQDWQPVMDQIREWIFINQNSESSRTAND